MDKQQAWRFYFDVMQGQGLGGSTTELRTAILAAGGNEAQVNYLLVFLAWPSALAGEDLVVFKEVVQMCNLSFRLEVFKLHFFVNDHPVPLLSRQSRQAKLLRQPILSLKKAVG